MLDELRVALASLPLSYPPVLFLGVFTLILAVYLVLGLFRAMPRKLPQQAVRCASRDAYRHPEHEVFLATTPVPGCTTLDRVFDHSVKNYPDCPAFGTREVLAIDKDEKEDGRVFIKQERGEYQWLTYKQADERIQRIGSGLVNMGIKPGSNVAIFASTCADWQLVAQACFRFGFPVVTVYATLGHDALVHALKETDSACVFTELTLLSKLTELLGELPAIKHIVYFDDETAGDESKGKQAAAGDAAAAAAAATAPTSDLNIEDMKVADLKEELRERGLPVSGLKAELQARLRSAVEGGAEGGAAQGKQNTCSLTDVEKRGDVEAERPVDVKPSDTAVIMYTSGSTGMPKGVVILHSNLVAAVAGMSKCVPGLCSDDVYIGYLPLAHVLELVAETCLLAHGACIGYSSPGTLSDSSAMIKAGTRGDVGVLRPTLMAAVPAVMERMRKAVNDRVASGSFIKRALFSLAYKRKLAAVERGHGAPLWDRLVFKKAIVPILGGRVRLMLSGGAPLDSKTERFMNVCFCCPVGQGYGLTETCGGGTICDPDDYTTGRAGRPVGCAEIRLVDWEEGGFSTQDKPHPRGEVWIGGPHIAAGYWKLEEKTKEDFKEADGQRWFATGDIGQIEEDGCLRIVDRKKDLVKLTHGEYVSLGKVESVLKTSPVVENVCVYASSHHSFCVAIVVPQEAKLRTLVGDSDKSFADLCASPEAAEAMLRDFRNLGKEAKLAKFEIPTKVLLTCDEWTPENELVTAALKLKRKNINDKYKEEIAKLYEGDE